MHRLRICRKRGSGAAVKPNPQVILARTPFSESHPMDTTRQPQCMDRPQIPAGCSVHAILGAAGSTWPPLEITPGIVHQATGQGGEQQLSEDAVGILLPLISCLLTPFPAPAAMTGILSPHLSCKTTSKSDAALQSPALAGSRRQSPSFLELLSKISSAPWGWKPS